MFLDTRGILAPSRAFIVRRREPRYVYSTLFTMQRFLRFGPVVTRGMSLDISLGGMSALVCGAPRVGETVLIELPLRGKSIEMLAAVRHSSDAKSGFEFFPCLRLPAAELTAGYENWESAMTRCSHFHVWPELAATKAHIVIGKI
jgi:hypothetical protein